MLNKLIGIIKKSDSYSIDTEINTIDLIVILKQRAFQIMRGSWAKIFLKQSSGLFFKGKNVKIQHKNRLSTCANLILEDNVYINALSVDGVEFGANVTIQRDSILICTGVIRKLGKGIKLGNEVGLNARVYIGGQGGVQLGNKVIVGPDVKIFSENHIFDNIHIPIKEQGETRKGVKIKDDCWIGAGAIILDGVVLGEGCVVAAGSVVTKSYPSFSVLAGVPAKIIKTRQSL